MGKNLVVVESPAKAKTLAKYLGRNYQVCASVGHVLDLPKSKLGVDIENGFAPDYHVITGKKKIIDDLKKAAKGKDMVYLAPDPDREGEAIAWHIAEKIGVPREKIRRVLFNEITKAAVREAIKNPVELNSGLYDAQQARRILDRLVGYQVSPLLWKKVRRGLSAGRVQSVAVRVVVEREREIRAFKAVEYWSITAALAAGTPPPFEARLVEVSGKRLDPKGFRVENGAMAESIVEHARRADWVVGSVETKERRRNPQPPFITSRLQQEASRKLSYNPRRTMGIAQKLYEGVEVGSDGPVGLITYMRTDSTRISPDAQRQARELIALRFGARYVPESPPTYRSRKQAQDAHEAIRPTSLEYTPDRVAPYLESSELALYTLIWNRFIASQMSPAVYDQTAIDIPIAEYLFRANGQVLKFDGFMRVYTEGVDEKPKDADESANADGEVGGGADGNRLLPPLAAGDRLQLNELTPEQHFTQPPPRFTQATLIKELEEKGIGRPSTYASIMGVILEKDYVNEDEQRRLRPSELGMLVTELLVESFPDIFNVEFTAGMEEILDGVEEGRESWVDVTRRFYEPFKADLDRADEHMRDVKTEAKPTDLICERCASPMVVKWGRRGEFIACNNYPECRNTKNFTRADDGSLQIAKEETIDRICPLCGKPMQIRFGRFGKFVGCTGYPDCRQVQPLKLPEPIGIKCPECIEGEVVAKFSRKRKMFFSCNRYPTCTFVAWDRPILEPCPKCASKFLVEKVTKRYGAEKRCPNKECDFREPWEAPEAASDLAPPVNGAGPSANGKGGEHPAAAAEPVAPPPPH